MSQGKWKTLAVIGGYAVVGPFVVSLRLYLPNIKSREIKIVPYGTPKDEAFEVFVKDCHYYKQIEAFAVGWHAYGNMQLSP